MSEKELIAELKKLKELSESDPEAAHGQADDLLIKFIGSSQVTKVFNSIKKYYA